MKKIIAFSLIIIASCSSAIGATHCEQNEVVYFSCKIKNSLKVASLCGSTVSISDNSGWLQYKFGKLNSEPELVYPADKKDSIKHFNGEYGSFLGEDNIRGYYDRIWFNNGSTEYGIFVDQGDNYFYGVRVFFGGKQYDFPCDMNGINFGGSGEHGFQHIVRELSPIE